MDPASPAIFIYFLVLPSSYTILQLFNPFLISATETAELAGGQKKFSMTFSNPNWTIVGGGPTKNLSTKETVLSNVDTRRGDLVKRLEEFKKKLMEFADRQQQFQEALMNKSAQIARAQSKQFDLEERLHEKVVRYRRLEEEYKNLQIQLTQRLAEVHRVEAEKNHLQLHFLDLSSKVVEAETMYNDYQSELLHKSDLLTNLFQNQQNIKQVIQQRSAHLIKLESRQNDLKQQDQQQSLVLINLKVKRSKISQKLKAKADLTEGLKYELNSMERQLTNMAVHFDQMDEGVQQVQVKVENKAGEVKEAEYFLKKLKEQLAQKTAQILTVDQNHEKNMRRFQAAHQNDQLTVMASINKKRGEEGGGGGGLTKILERIQKIEIETLNLKKFVRKMMDEQVPPGFIYTQLTGSGEAKTLWPTFSWRDVTHRWAGLFFRAGGGDAASFGKIQIENYPPPAILLDLQEVGPSSTNEKISNLAVPPNNLTHNGWSNVVTITGGTTDIHENDDHMKGGDWIQFKSGGGCGGGGVWPRNTAVRVWQRQ